MRKGLPGLYAANTNTWYGTLTFSAGSTATKLQSKQQKKPNLSDDTNVTSPYYLIEKCERRPQALGRTGFNACSSLIALSASARDFIRTKAQPLWRLDTLSLNTTASDTGPNKLKSCNAAHTLKRKSISRRPSKNEKSARLLL